VETAARALPASTPVSLAAGLGNRFQQLQQCPQCTQFTYPTGRNRCHNTC